MTSHSCELKGKVERLFMYLYSMFIKIMTSHIVLSTPVENPANSSNPVESGLVFEIVKSCSVRLQINSNPAIIPDLVPHCLNPQSLNPQH